MDCDTLTPQMVVTNAQENCNPDHAKNSTKISLVAPENNEIQGTPARKSDPHVTHNSNNTERTPRRRPLQTIDSNQIAIISTSLSTSKNQLDDVKKPHPSDESVKCATPIQYYNHRRASSPVSIVNEEHEQEETKERNLQRDLRFEMYNRTSDRNINDRTAIAHATLSGHKRQHHQQDVSAIVDDLFDNEERQPYEENLAWLDMLLALLEKRYGRYSIPVCIQDLQEARMFEPQWKKQHYESVDLVSKNGMLSHPNSYSNPQRGDTQSRDTTSRLREDQERDERRQRILLRHAQQIQETSVSSTTCCGCKTGCLKMYCVCFSTRGFCNPNCGCEDCKNTRQNKDQRVEAIQSYLTNDPRAFSFASQQPNAITTGFLHLLPQKSSSVVLRGCRCKKSKCLKKYCECFQNGIACTSHCRCVECSNHSKASHHLHKAQLKTTTSDTTNINASSKRSAFHQIEVTVTKKPKRNYIHKSIRLCL